jgi:hypothetical protein
MPYSMCRPRLGPATRSFALVSIFACTGRVLADDGRQGGTPPPLHPTILVATFEGKSYPVTAVHNEIAEIEVDGKLRKLPSLQSFATPLAVGYAPGFVQFTAQKASSRQFRRSYYIRGDIRTDGDELIPGATLSASGEYTCRLVPAETHEECFLAVVFCGVDAEGLPDTSQTAIAFGEVGTLAPGHETPVTINCAYVAPRSGRYFCFPLLFSKGLEIRTFQCDFAAQFFHTRDVKGHDLLLARYFQQFPAADKPAVAYLRFPPELPVGQDPRKLPRDIEARFDVTGSGRVESVNLTPGLDPRVSASIERALDGWLFLPRLKKGVPTRTTIRLPLSFDSAS